MPTADSAVNGDELGMLVRLPKIQKLKRARAARQMRGRPITGEELDRMLVACDKVRPSDAPLWKGYLQGLWYSGLRLSESLTLSWDADSPMSLDFSGEYPCLRISAEVEKGFKDRLLPITREFAEYLDETPQELRIGKVFRVAELGLRVDTVSKIVCAIGAKAGVVVNREQNKFASAHDLRRAFGNRWASEVMPIVLQQLMRHESIETTMKYYISQSAQSIAASLWAKVGHDQLSDRKSGAHDGDAVGRPSDKGNAPEN